MEISNDELISTLKRKLTELELCVQARCFDCGAKSTPDVKWKLWCIHCIGLNFRPKRNPLTDQQLEKLIGFPNDGPAASVYYSIARTVERAHGIEEDV